MTRAQIPVPFPSSPTEAQRDLEALAVAIDAPAPSTTHTSNWTFVLADRQTVVEGNSAGALTFTVPPHSSVPFPVNTVIEVFQYGAGQITLAMGLGVTPRSDGGKVKTAGQYATIGLRQRALDEWVISGDLV